MAELDLEERIKFPHLAGSDSVYRLFSNSGALGWADWKKLSFQTVLKNLCF